MTKYSRFLLVVTLFCLSLSVLRAQIDVPVDLHTGSPIISLPLHVISEGDLSVPISYSYRSGAVKLEQQKAAWEVVAGGSISRQVLGLPDDFKGTGTDTRMGWLHGNGPTAAKSFPEVTTSDPAILNAYYLTIQGYSGVIDTESDVYTFSCGSVSAQFIFDNEKIIQTLPWQDISITPAYASDGSIASFTIITSDGIIYEFTPIRTVKETAKPDVALNDIIYMREKYLKYASPITYTAQWGLSEVRSPSGAKINLDYELPEGGGITYGLSPSSIFIKNVEKKLYSVETVATTKKLKRVYTRTEEFREEISLQECGLRLEKCHYVLNYKGAVLKRFRVEPTGISTFNNCKWENAGYQFEYNDALPNISNLADRYQQDYWGNYLGGSGNASLLPILYYLPDYANAASLHPVPGATTLADGYDRNANINTVARGALKSIWFPAGGSVNLEYQSNNFLHAGVYVNGGGIRVSKVTINDGISAANNIVKEYKYAEGRLLSRPQYSLAVHTNSTIENGMAKTTYDLNPHVFDGPVVVYGQAEERQPGKGKTVYTYSTPAIYGETTAPEYPAPDDWKPTTVNISTFYTNLQTGETVSKGRMIRGYNCYPYPPNPNYGVERGLLQNVKIYNEAGQVIKEKKYEYVPIYQNASLKKAYGFAIDAFSHNVADSRMQVYTHAKYEIRTGMNKVMRKEIEIVGDPTDLTRKATTETVYNYDSPNHRMLSGTSSSVTNGGSANTTTYRTKFKYPADFNVPASASDPAAVSLKKLKERFMNAYVVEKISTIQQNQLEKVTGGTVTKFGTFSGDRVFPAQVYNLQIGSAINDFTPSSIDGTGTFKTDSRYKLVSNFTAYNAVGNFVTGDDGKESYASVHYNFSGSTPIARIKNARANEVAYSSFEHDDDGQYSFGTTTPNLSNGYPKGRIGFSINTLANYVFSKTNLRKGIGQNYIFTCWIRATVAGSLTVTLSDGSAHSSVKSIPYTNTSGQWTFYRIKIPVTGFDALFNISAKTNVAAQFDEMAFYPELAGVSFTTFNYSSPHKAGESDGSGNLTLYEYDEFGRLTYVRDKNDHILKRQTYSYNAEKSKVKAIFSIYKSELYVPGGANTEINTALINEPIRFEGVYEELSGYNSSHKRSWNFGDGTTSEDQGAGAVHTYTSPGTYKVSSIVSDPIYGYDVFQKNIVITTPIQSIDVNICTGGVMVYDYCANQIITRGACENYPVGTNSFEARITRGCSGQYVYKWERAPASAPNAWQTVRTSPPTSATTDKITQIANPPNPGFPRSENSYVIRCTVTPTCSGVVPSVNSTNISFIGNCN